MSTGNTVLLSVMTALVLSAPAMTLAQQPAETAIPSNILSWKKLGMVGLVTSGGLGDTDEIIHHKVPTYFRRLARGIRPGRNELESVNRP